MGSSSQFSALADIKTADAQQKAPDVAGGISQSSPLQDEAIKHLAFAPKNNTALLASASENHLAKEVLDPMDYAEKALMNPAEPLPQDNISVISNKSASSKPLASVLVVQDGKEYLNLSNPYTVNAKAAADRKIGIA